MKKGLLIFFLFAISITVTAQQNLGKDHSKSNITCKTCHVCDVPTKDDPCLVPCPREKMKTVYESPDKTVDVVSLEELSKKYLPVIFSHRVHAQMSVMSGGCGTCHHYNTSGPIQSCKNCHQTYRNRDDISKPDLEAAYHRQCITCHREWSHGTNCNSCHSPKMDKKGFQKEEAKKKVMGKVHPALIEPDKIVFETKYEKGKMVTFFHDDHTKKFKIECTSCHKNETCLKCHDVNKASIEKSKIVKAQKSLDEHHKKCFSCHKEDKCGSCHLNKSAEPFEHGKKTGWALNKFHVNLSCAKCHGSKMPYTKLDNKCSSCHKAWNNETFKHSITGLGLDETHSQLNCEDCHAENNYTVKPVCSNCHENYSFPKQKPGKLVGRK
ncbi:MAG: cytochrome c family protein [Ignavibacteriaceae bacterium]|nr:cytochrome c family protein [Ignavibacteriaceae bacterium]